MIFSRTMFLAFLPLLKWFSFLILLLGKKITTAKSINMALSTATFFAIAAPWYWKNHEDIFGYLFSFGHGAHASEYGPYVGIFNMANLTLWINAINTLIHPIHFAIVAFSFVFYLVSVFLNRRFLNRRRLGADKQKYSRFHAWCFACLFVTSTTRTWD
jgi:hypothetical protein